MELKKKFEEILLDEFHHLHDALPYDMATYPAIDKARRACTKLCLEEQIKFLQSLLNADKEWLYYNISNGIFIKSLKQQLKEFENEKSD